MSEVHATRAPVSDWAIIGVCFLALAITYSGRAILGVTMAPLEASQGWSREFNSSVGALSLIVMAIVAPVGGLILDRLGPRVVLGGGLFLVAAGMAVSSALSEKWHYLIGYGGLAAAGFGIGTMSAIATVIYGSVSRRSGLAVGLATSGATAGQIVLVPALAAIVTEIGWRTGYLTVALAAVGLGGVGWLIAGRTTNVRRHDKAQAKESATSALASLGKFARSPVFHALFWSFMVCGFTTTGVIETHLIPYAAFCGIPPVPSATIYGLLSGINLLGMVLAGYLSDHVHRPFFLGTLYVGRAFTFLLLMFIGQDFELMLIFAVLFGLVDYATVPVTTSIARSHFGIGRLGFVMGLMTAGHSIGGALGAYTGGAMFDALGTYVWVWLAALTIALLGGAIAFTIEEPERRVPWRRRHVVVTA